MQKQTLISAIILSTILSLPLGGSGWASAQDVHFSQFNMTPLLINPALTGVFGGDQRVFLNYKNQWQGMGMSSATYNTALFSFDTHLFKKKWSKGYLGAGINAYKDVAGDLKMGTAQLNMSIAGIVFINEQQFLSGGVQGGYVQKSVSTTAMLWENQYDAGSGTFNTSLLASDVSTAPVSYGNFSTGLAWSYTTDQSTLSSNNQLKINLGLAALNINTPNQNFADYNSNEQLYSRFVFHGTAHIGIKNTNMALMPNAVLFKQGSSYELNAGTLVRFTIRDESKYTGFIKETALSLGAQYRMKDALIPVILFEYAQYAIGLSYDVNTSSLRQGTQGRGGIEISLRYLNPNPFHHTVSRLYNLK